MTQRYKVKNAVGKIALIYLLIVGLHKLTVKIIQYLESAVSKKK